MSKKQQTGKKKSVIQNYGLFWRKDRVNWKGNPVSLCGVEKDSASNKVDFREQKGIYALYANYKLVYVGQMTRTLYERLNQQAASLKPLFPRRLRGSGADQKPGW